MGGLLSDGDFDGDTDLDLFLANGAVKIAEEYAHLDYPYPFPNQLILNSGPPHFAFRDASQEGGSDVTKPEVSRGAAFGDIDNDGDIDILISNSNGPLRLLRNDRGNRQNAWLTLKLVGSSSNRGALGAEVRLATQLRRVRTDGSYCSANDPRVHFGLGDDHGAQSVTVTWPSGLVERFDDLQAGRETTLTEGSSSP